MRSSTDDLGMLNPVGGEILNSNSAGRRSRKKIKMKCRKIALNSIRNVEDLRPWPVFDVSFARVYCVGGVVRVTTVSLPHFYSF